MDSITPDLSVQNAVITNLQQQQSHVRQEVDNLTYWKQQLRDSALALDLPTDYPRSPNQTYARATHSFTLSAPLSATLKMLSRQEGVSLFAILFTAFQTLLYRYTGQEDLLVGTTGLEFTRTGDIFSRNSFVDPLVLRTYLVGSSPIREVLGHVQRVLLEGLAHQDIPFDQVVEVLQLERDLNRNPLYQVMFVMELALIEARIGQDQQPVSFMNSAANNSMKMVDLALFVRDSAQEISGKIEYNSDLFNLSTHCPC